jgi:bloom syndrome protein
MRPEVEVQNLTSDEEDEDVRVLSRSAGTARRKEAMLAGGGLAGVGIESGQGKGKAREVMEVEDDLWDEFQDLGENVFFDDDDAEFGLAKEPSYPPPRYSSVVPLAHHSNSKIRTSSIVSRISKPSKLKATHSAEDFSYPWSKEAVSVLADTFQLRSFRSNQLSAINATLDGKDVFVLMPTGGGKSLCYQLPSQITTGKTSGVTVVVSPLISLIHDQCSHLHELGINAIPYTGDMPAGEKREATTLLNGGSSGRDPVDGFVLYVTPEMLGKSGQFKSLVRSVYRKGKLARFVIDEAHCVSSVCLCVPPLSDSRGLYSY